MPAGSVTVAASGTVTKTGLAATIYDAIVANMANIKPPGTIPEGPSGFSTKNGIAQGANALATALYSATVQTGTIVLSADGTVWTGYLACDGSAVSRTTYADLFAEISTTYGVGDGATTFNLPPSVVAPFASAVYLIKV
jgi:hypothetical protein